MGIALYDELIIQSGFSLSNQDMETLTFLYQPIIGPDSYSLYLTMTYYGMNNQNKLITILNKEICDILGVSILNFEKSRSKLEAVGLVQTFSDGEKTYCILRNPLSPFKFINETQLGAILKNTIGEQLFNIIASRFKAEEVNIKSLNEITKSLNDCFNINNDEIKISNLKEKKIKKLAYKFDYELFLDKSKNYISEQDKTRSLKNKVLKLAELYMFNETDMKRVVMNSFNKNRIFEITEMDNAAAELDRKKNKGNVMIELRDEVNVNVTDEMKKSLNEKIKKLFMVSTPEYVKIISEIMSKTGLNLEVMEMMLEEVSKNTNGVFPNVKYFEKTAASYVQRGIKSKNDLVKRDDNDLIDDFLKSMNGGSKYEWDNRWNK